MDGSYTLEVTWTESLGPGTLVNRLAQVQELAGGPGGFTRITGIASYNLQELIQSDQFNRQEAAQCWVRSWGKVGCRCDASAQ